MHQQTLGQGPCIKDPASRTLRQGPCDKVLATETLQPAVPSRSADGALRLALMEEEDLDLGALGGEEEAFDDMKGGSLDPEKVRESRLVKLRYLWDRKVYDYTSRTEARQKGKRPDRLKWLDTNKGDH